jgi:rhodanese-related sulfurtransferase
MVGVNEEGSSIDALLERARTTIARHTPNAAHERVRAGALLIDIRPAAQRAQFGEVPGALLIERNVLEWRLDPRSAHRIPEAISRGLDVIVLCQQGYASSLAAASLRELGFAQASDVIGGFDAWQSAGLPTQ